MRMSQIHHTHTHFREPRAPHWACHWSSRKPCSQSAPRQLTFLCSPFSSLVCVCFFPFFWHCLGKAQSRFQDTPQGTRASPLLWPGRRLVVAGTAPGSWPLKGGLFVFFATSILFEVCGADTNTHTRTHAHTHTHTFSSSLHHVKKILFWRVRVLSMFLLFVLLFVSLLFCSHYH